MNYLPQLTEEELKYVCSVIPPTEVVQYFKSNPKEFAKIRPGFRPTSINATDIAKILLNNKNRRFINAFLEKVIESWIIQIDKCLKQNMDKGESFQLSCLHTLPDSYFVGNVSLYFKLVNKDYSEEYISLMSDAINDINNGCKNSRQIEELERKFNNECFKLNSIIDAQKIQINQITQNSKDKDVEIKKVSNNLIRAEEIIKEINQELICKEEKIKNMGKDLEVAQNKIEQLEKEIEENNKEKHNLIEKLKTKEEEEKFYFNQINVKLVQPKRPCDMDEFKEYFEYNLNAIGISRSTIGWRLLIEHMEKIIFSGIPILIKSNAGINLSRCIANTLYGQKNVEILKYSPEIVSTDISKFLFASGRVICLDGFIGNYNELELFSMINHVRDKIIFVTFFYDRTLNYVAEEMFTLCNYVNVNRIGEFSIIQDIEEDPSEISECEYTRILRGENSRYKKICREILKECGMPSSIIEYYCAQINDEKDLCRIMAFVLLPYISDVMEKSPYNCSKRLQKYAGKSGRCPEKELFIGWFG